MKARKWKMKKRKLAVAFGLLLLSASLTGCTVSLSPNTQKQSTKEEATQTQEEETSASPDKEDAEISGEKENEKYRQTEQHDIAENGNYFVKVDNQVYYRVYPLQALEPSAVGGEFLQNPTGKESTLMCYDTTTQTATPMFSDSGCGKIAYLQDRFYMTKADGTLYSCDLDGSNVNVLSTETQIFDGVDDKTESLITTQYDVDNQASLCIWQNDEKVATVADEKDIQYAFAEDGYLYYTQGLESPVLKGYDIASGNTYAYGELPETQVGVFGDARAEDGNVYVAWGWTAGSAGEIQEVKILEVVPNEEDSLVIEQEVNLDDIEWELPSLTYQDGEIGYQARKDGYVKISEDGNLEKYDQGSYQNLQEGFTKNLDDEKAIDSIETQISVDGITYVMYHTMQHDEKNDIGWRWAYTRKATKYIAIDTSTGDMIEMK